MVHTIANLKVGDRFYRLDKERPLIGDGYRKKSDDLYIKISYAMINAVNTKDGSLYTIKEDEPLAQVVTHVTI